MSRQQAPASSTAAANRRNMLRGIGLSIGAAGLATMALQSAHADTTPAFLEPQAADTLAALTAKIANAPRRRNFKTVPMILTSPDQWDSEALNVVIAYSGSPKQIWDNAVIESPWLNLMRNAVNAQVYSWKNPNFLAANHLDQHK